MSLLGVVLLLGLTTGCVGPRPTLKPAVVATVNRTGVRFFMPQTEVKAEFLESGYGGGGGLIGAIIDASVTSGRQANAEKRVQELRAKVRDLDVRGLYTRALSNTVMGVSWLKADRFEDLPGTKLPPVKKETVAQCALLNVGADYYISQDCRVLVLTTGLGFYPPGKPRTPTAANIVSYHSAEVGKPDAEQAIALWAADDGAAFRKAVLEAIDQDTKLLRLALEYMGGPATTPATPVTIRARLLHARGDFGIKVGQVKLRGTILEQDADRLIFRTTTGQFYSLPRREVEVK